MPPKIFSKSGHLSYKVLVPVGLLIVVALLILVHIFLPYIDNKGKLVKETALIRPSPYITMSQVYVNGACLDNCPELTTTFTIPTTTLGAERTAIANLLRSKGYTFDKPMTGDKTLSASRGKFYLDVGFGGNSGSPDIIENNSRDDTAPINKLVFTLDYTL